MGAMLSAGWCVPQPDGSSKVACPFHALEFNSAGCTVLPGSNKPTTSLMEPLELIIQGDFIWSYGGYEPKIPIPTSLNEIAAEYEFIGFTGDRSIKNAIYLSQNPPKIHGCMLYYLELEVLLFIC